MSRKEYSRAPQGEELLSGLQRGGQIWGWGLETALWQVQLCPECQQDHSPPTGVKRRE